MELKPLSTGKIIGLIVLGVLVVLALWVMVSYNSLVTLRENAITAQADVEVQYQRRFDLIPNLVTAVQGVLQQEQKVFKDLADARSRYSGSQVGTQERISSINQVETSLSRLLVVMENYPVLKSSENVKALQDQLEGTENRVSVARSNFNAFANELNKRVQFFPTNIVAKVFSFEQMERFQVQQQEAKAAPKVEQLVK